MATFLIFISMLAVFLIVIYISTKLTQGAVVSKYHSIKIISIAGCVALITGTIFSLLLAYLGEPSIKITRPQLKEIDPVKSNITLVVIEETKSDVVKHTGPESKKSKPVKKVTLSDVLQYPEVKMQKLIRRNVKTENISKDVYKNILQHAKKCAKTDVVHVQNGNVRCLKINSNLVQELLGNAETNKMQRPMHQSVFAVANVAEDVAERKNTVNRIAEVIYFFLTFMGVIARFFCDQVLGSNSNAGKNSTNKYFRYHTVVLALFLAISVHLIIAKSMGNIYQCIKFQSMLLAVYNGFVWPVLLKDINEFKNLKLNARNTG